MRIDGYLELCQWVRSQFPEEKDPQARRILARFSGIGDINFSNRLPEICRPIKSDQCIEENPLITLYFKHGDVFKIDFDDYWKKYTKINGKELENAGQHGIIRRWPVRTKPVDYYKKIVQYDLQDAERRYINATENPTIKGFIEYFTHYIEDGHGDILLLIRPYEHYSIEKYKSNFSSIIKKEFLSNRFRKDELKRYLAVYDLKKQGLTYKQICRELEPNCRGNCSNSKDKKCQYDELKRVSLTSDYRKAKQKMNNILSGKAIWW